MGGSGSGRTRTKPYCPNCDVPLAGPDVEGITDGSGELFEQWHCPKRGDDGCGNQIFTYYALEDYWDYEEDDGEDW